MKQKFFLIAAVACLICLIMALLTRIKVLQSEYSLAVNNFKAYEELFSRRFDSVNKKNYELKYTKQQLEYSNDSIIQHLNALRKELKIKDKNLEGLQYVGTVTTRTDSIFFRDTIFSTDLHLDTTLSDNWRNLNIKLDYPNKINVNSTFNNELSIVVSTEKQTIKPPSKVFFVRWFQKKQKLVKVDVIDANPYATIKEQRFVEIIK